MNPGLRIFPGAATNQQKHYEMIKIIDIQNKFDAIYSWNDDKFDAIVVTAFVDDNEVYNDYYFGRDEDEDVAIEECVDSYFYGYLPEWCFESLSPHNIRDIWDYIEKNFD